jgi:hypothetical protein
MASVVYLRPILDGSDALYLLLILDFCVINQNQNSTFIQYNSKNSIHYVNANTYLADIT